MPPAAIELSADCSDLVASPGLLIEPDSQDSGSDSAGDSATTRSLTSSVFKHVEENGRKYHRYREGSYVFPNDELENERLDLQYELLKFVFGGKAYYAPITNPKKILDIGTGTGMWPIEMGESPHPLITIFEVRINLFCSGGVPEVRSRFYKELVYEITSTDWKHQITGTDLSPIQPDWVPDNVHFVIDDAAEDDWLYPPSSFDYIHTRVLLGCFEDFRTIIAKGFRYTKPGGWMESQEWFPSVYCDDATMFPDWPFAEWSKYSDDAAMRLGRPLRIANKLKRWYEEAGFVDVHEEVYKMPLNPWPKDQRYKNIGHMQEMNWIDGLQAFSLALFHRVLGWSKNEIEVYLIDVRKALRDRGVHAYQKAYVGLHPSHHHV
ncbi:MAG: hypothetical protein M1827_006041 [Pycnora praestabilis]|nr:MAG: hypothetical protein M1827_006041 [Pycnora praestabilis]